MTTIHFFDVHTHAHFAAFRDDSDAVIRRALEAGVTMVNVGTQRDTSAAAVATAERYEQGVYASVGLHPIHTERSYHDAKELGSMNQESGDGFTSRGEDFDYDYYKHLAVHPKVVAIGECGLDYYRIKNQESRIKQEAVFRQQIELSLAVRKPLMVHCRDAFDDLIKILDSYFMIHNSSNPGIIHFFTGSLDDARALLDLGFSFSFGGVTTFTRDYDDQVHFIPLDRILSETDAPYVAPVPYRGTRNEPVYVREVVARIALIRGEDETRVREALALNAGRVFGLG
ncbi:MAG: TatD family hydrolase [bacterium]|nr:TatD family hydrolase [bacterium]MDZ4284298.1 TatD family hydrolase [Patescibacteria group bacterium]